jgi:transposase InsO family protein
MPWQECDVVSMREEFCRLASLPEVKMSVLCRRFGISRKTGYKWRARFHSGEACVNRSRRPRHFREPTSAAMEAEVLELRDRHPAWGGRKLRARLVALGRRAVPAASTITAILHRHGRIEQEESLKRAPVQRFEREAPNELWQMDFKGDFRTVDGRRCHPLTITDDHSRYSLGLQACLNQRSETVQESLRGVFRRYGLPWSMLTDNGTPWAVTHRRGGYTKLSVWLLRHNIRLIHGRAYHPQTQGKEERFHRTLQAEVLRGRAFANSTEVQREFDRWRQTYNHERPHEALGLAVPGSCYEVSRREFPERLPPIEYDAEDEVRKVNPVGQLSFQGRVIKISEALAGEPVALRPTTTEGVWQVFYCWQKIARIDLRERDAEGT